MPDTPTTAAQPGPASRVRLGLVVNPIAGMGGPVGLKGTDGRERLARAIELGARPTAARKASLALERLSAAGPLTTIVAAAGGMGAALALRHGFPTETLPVGSDGPTSGADTRDAAAEMAARDVDLLLFAGGDGTARDVLAAVGSRVPALGVPTGVKMHSGVFAVTAAAAGEIAAAHLRRTRADRDLLRAEVVDRAFDDRGEPGPVQLYGELLVPRQPASVLAAKAAGPSSGEASLRGLQAEIVREMEPGRLYLLGPGGTVGGIRRALGIPDRPLAIAAVRDRELVADDLNEEAMLALLDDASAATLLLGVIGGQGSLLGRGNQQISARVLRRIGLENLVIVSSLEKLTALSPPRLHVDTGDPALDEALAGHRPVRVAPRRSVMFEVTS